MHLATNCCGKYLCATMVALGAFLEPVSAQEVVQTVPMQPTAVVSSDAPATTHWAQGVPCENCPAICESQRSLSLKIVPYLWLTQMNGDLTLRGETAPVHLDMGKMWDLMTHDLNMAFLGQIEAKFGKAGLLANGIYMDLSPSTEVRRLQFNSDYSQTILDLAFTYDLLNGEGGYPSCKHPYFELLGGVRYNSLNGDVTITGPRGNTVNAGGAEDWVDPIIGARAYFPLCECVAIGCRADVGGFGINGCSQFTWNVEAVAEFQCSERTSMFLGYRVLDIDYATGEGNGRFAYDMRLDGPVTGFVIKF